MNTIPDPAGTQAATSPAATSKDGAADPATTIRRVSGTELLTTANPLWAYAFSSSPVPDEQVERQRAELESGEADDSRVNLVAFGGDEAEAVVAGISMRHNVRGTVFPMVGISGVATHPKARRRGHVRTLLTQMHEEMRDSGHVLSTLYPFRQSFYERFGYVGFPKPRSIRLEARGLERMLRVEVPGEVSVHRIGEVFDDYYALLETLLRERHGFSIFTRAGTVEVAKENKHWIVLARHEGEVVGALLYRTNGFGNELQGRQLLTRGPIGRTLLLQWLARHHDQYSSFTFELPPDERPDLWYVDLAYDDETKVSGPNHSAPMGRVLSVPGLAGIATGAARATVEVVDDPFVAGTWTLDGRGGTLEVTPGSAGGNGSGGTARLTSHGLAALVYGVIDPAELTLQGYGTVDAETAQALRTIFPPAAPYLFSGF
ncbi:Predicted acetyltransferase [Actinopolymorpha cephalotaxi]|uniref:Predicted acetyltransferase n=1 Tax=Actinopolymorpha cephalotaxi TaxID=504797 RepID=A0A1I2ND24_9ACTN|nr:GNAT family N-acetyltransferase [Actinopolymorpha cephalotaxi]NYH85588.1 ribosomal protein S18 acetylase RimI-like enzyme [Actinopolymorpha cephalotaxi]SFG01493.1 Predicted acetyltransferase [Actinopolymorpha cephalotaxi]